MNFHDQGRQYVVILSAAKDLPSERSFAALRMTGGDRFHSFASL